MAFLLALGGGVVLTYLWTSVSDAYDTVTKPISDYFTKIEQNSLENDKELRLIWGKISPENMPMKGVYNHGHAC